MGTGALARALAYRLLLLLVAAFVPDGPVVVGLDDTIERRRGKRITAKGIYRDPVRSSRGHFVKASGLRWLCVMLLAPVPWAGCVWGLPFLTVLAPSERYAAVQGKQHKKLTDWGRQALLQVARWLPGRRVVAVADSSFSAIALLRDLAPRLTVVTRLRLDARLCEPPPPRQPGKTGRPPVKGARLPSLSARLRNRRTPWRRVSLDGWYGRSTRRLDIVTGTALWHHPGMRVAIRWGSGHAPNGARPERRDGAAGLPLHRPGGRSGRHPALVRPPVEDRDHLRRSPSSSRHRLEALLPTSGSGRILLSYAPRPRCSLCSPS